MQVGLGVFVVKNGEFVGDLVAGDGEGYQIVGRVDPDGTAHFTQIKGDRGSEATALGRISGGVVQGLYDGTHGQGAFAGSRDNAPTEPILGTRFDGGYEVQFIREGEVQAETVFVVRGGRFRLEALDMADRRFEVEGWVTSDGTIVLNDAQVNDQGFTILAECTIDQDSGDINGVYRIGNLVGRVSGKKGD